MTGPPPLVFLGPSLPRTEAEGLCPGEYYGPIARGDLPVLAGRTPRPVVIIDGQFEHARAVSPKEVLATLDRGHAVYGSASMGALRGVELEPFGMQGVGRIFEAFRRGELVADDEVAVAFDRETLRPLSESLVRIRVALAEAVGAGLLAADESAGLLAAATRLHYPLRSFPRILADSGLSSETRRRLLDFVQHATDPKADDARAVLRLVAEGGARPRVTARDLPVRPVSPQPGPALQGLPPSPKCGPWDSVRTVPAADTEQRLARVRSLVGITRVADVQGLDVLGVPNFIAVRPSRDRHCNSAYSGKALRAEEARIGAQMEALEMACALDDRVPMERTSFQSLVTAGRRALHPDSLIPFYRAPRDLTQPKLEWVTGWDLTSGDPVVVPADVVFFRRDMRPTYWKISSNGLASGNTLAEAIAHGLAELIERDAETLFRVATEYAEVPGLLRIVAGPRRVAPPRGALPPPRDFPLICLDTLPEPLRGIVSSFQRQGVRVAVRSITSDVGVPSLLCVLWERTDDARRHLVQYGCGTHPDPRVAARRAITEAAQSRVTAIQGAREDLEAGAIARSAPPEEWFTGGHGGIDFGGVPRAAHADVRDDIAFMIDRLVRAALDQVIVVDLSNPAFDFPVVKMLVPGLELAFHTVDPNEVPFGWRARRYFEPDTEQPGAVTRQRAPLAAQACAG